MRLLTLVVGSLEIIAFTLAAHMLALSDFAGEQHAALVLVPLILLTIPALMLAIANRAPVIALAMVAVALPAAVLGLAGF